MPEIKMHASGKIYSFVVMGHEGTKSQRKFYSARENKTVHFFVDNQWFNAKKLYTSFTGVHFCQATKALSREENFTLPGK